MRGIRKIKFLLVLVILSFTSCSKETDTDNPTNPNSGVELTISEIKPLSGPEGTGVTVIGKNWSSEKSKIRLFFGDEGVEITDLKQDTLTFDIPDLDLGKYQVRLTSENKEAVFSKNFEITEIADPEEVGNDLKIKNIQPISGSTVVIPEKGVCYLKVDLTFSHPIQPLTFTSDEILKRTHPALKKTLTREIVSYIGENILKNRQLEGNLTQKTVNHPIDLLYNRDGNFSHILEYDASQPSKLSVYIAYSGEFVEQYQGDGIISFSIPAGVFYVKGSDGKVLNEKIALDWHLNILRASDLRVLNYTQFLKKDQFTFKCQLSGVLNTQGMELIVKDAKTGHMAQTISDKRINQENTTLFSKEISNIPKVTKFIQEGSEIILNRGDYSGEFLMEVNHPGKLTSKIPYYTLPGKSPQYVSEGPVKFSDLDFSVDKDGKSPTLKMTPSDDNHDLKSGEIVKIFDNITLEFSEPISFKRGVVKISYSEAGDKYFPTKDLLEFYDEEKFTFTIPYEKFRSNNRTLTDLKVELIDVVDYGGNTLDKLLYQATTFRPKRSSKRVKIRATDWVKEKINKPAQLSNMESKVYKYEAVLDMGFKSGLTSIVQPAASLSLLSDLFNRKKYNFSHFSINGPELFNRPTKNSSFLTVSGLPSNLWKVTGNRIVFYSNEDIEIPDGIEINITSMEVYGVDANNRYKAVHPW
ncbi:hypothetical protein FUAX_46400 (plasmid) [Fulvitalea axinellae]|uniref:IPT/TIG domain-containing protein n=1 Tax=Fulvitalea axinellae TaxID=1182444 RepID=A0AAU9CPM8_9BACT|nr:hypothetical protein FUAX_46400 [Fulvitalea axinellae]